MSEENLKMQISQLQSRIEHLIAENQNYAQSMELIDQKVEELISEAQSDINKMKELQKKLVPTEIKNISGFEFSTRFTAGYKVGGDYYDVFALEDKTRFAVFLASPNSHGLSALVLSLLIQMAPRLESRANMTVIDTVQKMIQGLTDKMTDKERLDIFYAIVDQKDLSIEYVTMGSIDFYCYQSQKKHWEKIPSTYAAISKNNVDEIKSNKIYLESMGQIVLLSPGFNLLPDSGQKYLNYLNQASHLNIHDLRNGLCFKSMELGPQDPPVRDQTVLVMQVKAKVIRLAKA